MVVLLVLKNPTTTWKYFECEDERQTDNGAERYMSTGKRKYAHEFDSIDAANKYKSEYPNGEDFEPVEEDVSL